MLTGPNPEVLESRVLAFEQSWRQNRAPVIADFLPGDCDAQTRLAVLTELICIDLECRWRASRDGEAGFTPLSLGDYVQHNPELGEAAQLPLELIGEDYRAENFGEIVPAMKQFSLHFQIGKRRSSLT